MSDCRPQTVGCSQEKRASKQANEGGHAPDMEHATLEQHPHDMPPDADAAAQAAAEGAEVQGVLDGALPQVLRRICACHSLETASTAIQISLPGTMHCGQRRAQLDSVQPQ
jgi:hypothetical protein